MAKEKAVREHILLLMTGAEGVPGGIACYNKNLVRALKGIALKKGLGLTVCSFLEGPEDRPAFIEDWITFYPMRGSKVGFVVEAWKRVSQAAIVVVDHVSLAAPLWPLARVGGVRIVIIAHGPEAWRKVKRRNLATYRVATKVLANSEFTLRKMEERFYRFDGEVCMPGLNPDIELNEELSRRGDESIELKAVDGHEYKLSEHVLLLVGRMSERQNGKGHEELIRALPRVLYEFPDAQLVFPGPGDARPRFMELAREIGVADSVFFPGFVSDELLKRLYLHSYAFTMPSRQDGFGLVYLEAMNYGKACVACYDDGGECVVVDGETGYLVEPKKGIADLEQVLLRLLRNPERTEEMGRAGFRRLHDKFTSEAFIERMNEALMPLL